MKTRSSAWIVLAVVPLILVACGGGNGGPGGKAGSSGGNAVIVVPTVPAGAHEADCQRLCTLAATDTICTAQHADFCLALCRASTRDLPAACATCVLAAGASIAGSTDSFGDKYCSVGGPAELSACEAACDDGGSAAPSPDLETLCQLQCAFYVQNPVPFACSASASAPCLASCRAAIAAHGRVCAQCLTEQTIPGSVCINNDCDCDITFEDSTSSCMSLCDTLPPT
jgi:hypothetical protein